MQKNTDIDGSSRARLRVDESSQRSRWASAPASILALCLIAVWVVWWVQSVRQDCLVGGRLLWIPTLPFLAGDLKVGIGHVAILRAQGINPYLRKDDWICAAIQYPPMVFRMFAWMSLVSMPAAVRLWLFVSTSVLMLGAYGAWRTRRALGLWPIPLAVIVVGVIYSTPALLALERGQGDPVIIGALLLAAWLLRRRLPWHEIAAGGLLGLTAWLKYAPGVVIVGLLALRRWKAAAAFLVVAGLIGLIDRADVQRSLENSRAMTKLWAGKSPAFHSTKHSLVESWRHLWLVRRLKPLRQVPAPLASAVLLLPVIVIVSRRMSQVREPGALVFPYFLWLAAAATYGMPQSLDYNLVPLPLAALAVWDRRDGIGVHICLALLLIWWQPFALPVAAEILLVVKLVGLYAVGGSLAFRAGEAGLRHSAPARSGFGSASKPDQPALHVSV
jgi:hypothetical protein